MARTRKSSSKLEKQASNGTAVATASADKRRKSQRRSSVVGAASSATKNHTDRTRWRLRELRGRQTWHYLESDDEVAKWPQSISDKYFLGMPMNLPALPPAENRPLDSVRNCLEFFEHLQLPSGNWGCEYGGPMFLIPGMVVTWYVTGTLDTDVSAPVKTELQNYLRARAHPEDGGWGLHIEGESTAFGTTMNYVAMRLLGVDADAPDMIKARATLMKLGGAVTGPHWAKFWLAVLGVVPWDLVNPVPADLWLVPDWMPIAPWRWWIHLRQVYLPMSWVYSKRWSYEPDELVLQLRNELFTEPYESINFASHRNSICPRDNYHPKSWVLNSLNWILCNIYEPYVRPNKIKERAEEWTWHLIQREDANTDFANLGPVNSPMNFLCCYIQEGPDSHSVRRHRDRVWDFFWMKDEGMLMNGTNGVQNWDTSFLVQAVCQAGLANDPRWKPMLLKSLAYLKMTQIDDNCVGQQTCYRHPRKGAWGFSEKDQGYTVSDCTSEAIKAIMQLQNINGYPEIVPERRLKDAVDILLTMQNASGGCSSYEPTRGSEYLELLNAAEVFGRIMVEYDYPECTTAVLTALDMFTKSYPDYRTDEIRAFMDRAIAYIYRSQRPDGSWFGSWGICFTYATMFGIESLAVAGEQYDNSERVRRACSFLIGHQMEDGGWGENYHSCETGVYSQHEQSQVVQTAWAAITLLEAGYPEQEPIRRALKLIMSRQQPNGEWLQEAIEGVFNKSCMISYPNYKFIFPIKALGIYTKVYGEDAL